MRLSPPPTYAVDRRYAASALLMLRVLAVLRVLLLLLRLLLLLLRLGLFLLFGENKRPRPLNQLLPGIFV